MTGDQGPQFASLTRRGRWWSRWERFDYRPQPLNSLVEVPVEASACAASRRRQEDPVSYIDVERSIFEDECRLRHHDEPLRLLCGSLTQREFERPVERGLEDESWRGWRFLSLLYHADRRRELRIRLLVCLLRCD